MTPAQQVAALADEAWALRLDEPFFRLRTGLPVERIPSGSLEEAERNAGRYGALAARIAAVDAAALSRRDRATHAFLLHAMRQGAASAQTWWENFPVTPYRSYGFAYSIQQIFAPFEFKAGGDADRYLSLLSDFAASVTATSDQMRRLAERGWRVPRPALPGARIAIERARAYAAVALVPAPERLASLGAAASALRDRISALASSGVDAAFAELLGVMGPDYERASADIVGLSWFPGGDAAYARAIEAQLTEAVDPTRLHAMGIEEVASITETMAALRSRNGWAASEGDFHAELRRSPRSYLPTPEAVEAVYRKHVERMKGFLPQYFHVTPKAPYDVARLAPEMEAGMTYGYYDAPIGPGVPGLYRYNGSGLETRMQLNAAPLILHELAPGHHFHLARQAENQDLHPIRREAIDITVFNEGWAEYASSLGVEMGLYDDPYDLYGRMIHERFIAQRLVVDTGLNALGWSLEKARDYMRLQTLESDAQIASETLRYSTDMPAQSLAYCYGYKRFWELRRKAEAAAPGLDIRDFHEAILSEGALPLGALEANLEAAFSAPAEGVPA